MIRGQKIGQWHRTKTYSSLVTGAFELRAEKRGGQWIGLVDRAEFQGPVPLVWADAKPGASQEDAEKATCAAARKLAAELLAVAEDGAASSLVAGVRSLTPSEATSKRASGSSADPPSLQASPASFAPSSYPSPAAARK